MTPWDSKVSFVLPSATGSSDGPAKYRISGARPAKRHVLGTNRDQICLQEKYGHKTQRTPTNKLNKQYSRKTRAPYQFCLSFQLKLRGKPTSKPIRQTPNQQATKPSSQKVAQQLKGYLSLMNLYGKTCLEMFSHQPQPMLVPHGRTLSSSSSGSTTSSGSSCISDSVCSS